jgi:hypothetical protein
MDPFLQWVGLRFGVGKIWYCGWVCDLGLENFSKFVLVGGFAIGGNSEMARRVIL